MHIRNHIHVLIVEATIRYMVNCLKIGTWHHNAVYLIIVFFNYSNNDKFPALALYKIIYTEDIVSTQPLTMYLQCIALTICRRVFFIQEVKE